MSTSQCSAISSCSEVSRFVELSTLCDVNLPFDPTLNLDTNKNYFRLMEDLENLCNKVHGNLLYAQQLQNDHPHMSAKSCNIKVGNIAYIKSSHAFRSRYSEGLVPTERNQSDIVIFRYVSESKIPMHTYSRSTMSLETGVGIWCMIGWSVGCVLCWTKIHCESTNYRQGNFYFYGVWQHIVYISIYQLNSWLSFISLVVKIC